MEKRGFKSLIVVTATYHMPRSLAELRRALPDVDFIAYPVRPRNLHLEEWWAYQGSLQLLAMEYAKFVPALGRCVPAEFGRGRGVFGGTRQCLNAESTGVSMAALADFLRRLLRQYGGFSDPGQPAAARAAPLGDGWP